VINKWIEIWNKDALEYEGIEYMELPTTIQKITKYQDYAAIRLHNGYVYEVDMKCTDS